MVDEKLFCLEMPKRFHITNRAFEPRALVKFASYYSRYTECIKVNISKVSEENFYFLDEVAAAEATTSGSGGVLTFEADEEVVFHSRCHEAKKSFSKLDRLFSATSIWFSRSPRSVVSACSIFQLRFSISASSWACWYSN